MRVVNLLADKVLPLFGAVAGIAVIGDGTAGDGLAMWIVRGFITFCIAVITFFMKKMFDDYRQANRDRDTKIETLETNYVSLVKITAAHEVMYEYWLETLVNETPHPEGGMRKTDRLDRIIKQLAGVEK